MKYKRLLWPILSILPLLAIGCMELPVENENTPDRERALAEPSDVESLIRDSYVLAWNMNHASNPVYAMSVMADVHTSSWMDFGKFDLSKEPRVPFENTQAYARRFVVQDPWERAYQAIMAVHAGLSMINMGMKITDAAGKDQTMRAKAFGKFVQGLAHGFLSCFFDKAYIIDETMDLEKERPPLMPYQEVNRAALKYFEECIRISNANTFELPTNWINGLVVSNTELIRVAYSYMARYRAAVARTPSERAAVDWARVIADAQKGVTADWGPWGDGHVNYFDELKRRGQDPGFAKADYYKFIGITDKSGLYERWMNTPVHLREPFDITTDDRRITGPGGPKTNGTDFMYDITRRHPEVRGKYHWSNYVHSRYRRYWTGGMVDQMIDIKTTELDLTIAEGLLRTGGSRATVAELINKTRVTRGKLPPVRATDSDEELWKWLKYEKLIETMSTGGGLQWFDRRGWGDLVPGTLLHFPIPAKELETLGMPLYTFGGVGNPGSAP